MASRRTGTSVASSYYPTQPYATDPRWIHARFERAVDIVQSLPRSGPIQTNYDDKLLLYSVYKQATEGDIKTARPGMLDVLGRAKWDAWNKRRGLSPLDAQARYVDALLRILRSFSDRPHAAALLRELDDFVLPLPEAPSLPGYGPPRTERDVVRPADSASDASSDRTDTTTEDDDDHDMPPPPPRGASSSRHQLPPPQVFSTPLQHPRSSHHSSSTPHAPSQSSQPYHHHALQDPFPVPSRVLSPYQPLMSSSFPPASTPAPAPPPPPPPPQQQQPELSAALDRIQTSLSALHERLTTLERERRQQLAAQPASLMVMLRQRMSLATVLGVLRRLLGDVAVAVVLVALFGRGVAWLWGPGPARRARGDVR